MAERPAAQGLAHAEGLVRTSLGDFRLRETVHYPNGGSSSFYVLGRMALVVDDGICALTDGQPAFDYSLITSKAIVAAPW